MVLFSNLNKYIKNKRYKLDYYYLLLVIITIIGCVFFTDKIDKPMIDYGRELYFPLEVLENKILYKDIFNLFGPFSYLFTALIFKLFGSGLNTIYAIGYVSSLLFISGFYIISRLFLRKDYSFVITLFAILTGVITYSNFSYVHSYSYAMVYGMIFFIYSLYFFLRAISEKNYNFYIISSIFTGFAASSKYEFVIYSMLVIIVTVILNLKNIKVIISSLVLIVLPFLIQLIYLLHCGLTLSEFFNFTFSLNSFIDTKGAQFLYRKVGSLFYLGNFKIVLISFINTVLTFIFFYYSYIFMKKKRILAILLLIIGIQYANFFLLKDVRNVISYMPILLTILYILNFKQKDCPNKNSRKAEGVTKRTSETKLKIVNLYAELSEFLRVATLKGEPYDGSDEEAAEGDTRLNIKCRFLVIAVIVVSLKVFWYTNINLYGSYTSALMVLAFIILLKSKRLKLISIIFLFLYCFCIFYHILPEYKKFSFPIKTKKGTIYTTKDTAYKINKTIKYIKNNTQKEDKIIILPEGLFINYLTGRKSDAYYYALSPLYEQYWGEDFLINYFSKIENRPEYFIFTNKNMKEYGCDYMCKDYAQNFCVFVKENYELVKVIEYMKNDKQKYEIYRKKD